MIRKARKSIVRWLLRVLVAIFAYALLLPFLWGPIYDFPEPQPFSGKHFFNPYQGIDSNSWFKGNFHAHANPYGILTDGRNNTSEKLWNKYDSLNYASFSISNYSNIDDYNSSESCYIPNYEHGYSPVKYHQLVLGATKVQYFDYPLFQFRSNKQYIIDKLRQDAEVLVIAHPSFLGAYSEKDGALLCNYNLVEVMNQRKYSFEFWDAALSAGHAVWIMANDDAHDLDLVADYGMQATLINAPSNDKSDVLNALKSGKTIGYAPVNDNNLGLQLKLQHRDAYPRLLHFEVDEFGKIEGRFSKPIKEFHVIAQNGEEVHYEYTEYQNNHKIWAQFEQQHQYLRFKVNFEDADLCFLNPVIRYNGEKLTKRLATISIWKTLVWRGLTWTLLLLITVFGIRYIKKRRELSKTSP